jgi:hypothetical protein
MAQMAIKDLTSYLLKVSSSTCSLLRSIEKQLFSWKSAKIFGFKMEESSSRVLPSNKHSSFLLEDEKFGNKKVGIVVFHSSSSQLRSSFHLFHRNLYLSPCFLKAILRREKFCVCYFFLTYFL